jgi:hypothetical protein
MTGSSRRSSVWNTVFSMASRPKAPRAIVNPAILKVAG